MLLTPPNLLSSLFDFSAQANYARSGRITTVGVTTISSGGGTPVVDIAATANGYSRPVEEVKSPAMVLREQVDKVLDNLQQQLDGAATELKKTWAAAVEDGRLQADPQTSLADMQNMAKVKGALPEDLQAHVLAYGLAATNMTALRDKANAEVSAFSKSEAEEYQRVVNQMVTDTILALADAQVHAEFSGKQVDDSARNALALIRAARDGSAPQADPTSEEMDALREDMRAQAMQKRRSALIDEINEQIDKGELRITAKIVQYWGEPDITVKTRDGGVSMTSVQKSDASFNIGVGADLLTGQLSIRF